MIPVRGWFEAMLHPTRLIRGGQYDPDYTTAEFEKSKDARKFFYPLIDIAESHQDRIKKRCLNDSQ